MKNTFYRLIMILFLASCNNAVEEKNGIGDSMEQDPQTGQPITTQPDTVGVKVKDTIGTNKNKQ